MNFTAQPKSTIGIAATNAASAPLQFGPSSLTDVAVFNPDSTTVIYVEFGSASVAAVVPGVGVKGSMPIPPGALITMTGGPYISTITSGGSATLLLTPGNGS